MKPKVLIAIAAVTACSKTHDHLQAVSAVRVVETGMLQSPDAHLCAGFTLNAEEASLFLKTASIISASERDHEFDWSSCFAKGTALINGRAASWKIEAGGLASVLPDGGPEIVLGNEEYRYVEGH